MTLKFSLEDKMKCDLNLWRKVIFQKSRCGDIFYELDYTLFWLYQCQKSSKILLLPWLDGKTRCLFLFRYVVIVCLFIIFINLISHCYKYIFVIFRFLNINSYFVISAGCFVISAGCVEL